MLIQLAALFVVSYSDASLHNRRSFANDPSLVSSRNSFFDFWDKDAYLDPAVVREEPLVQAINNVEESTSATVAKTSETAQATNSTPTGSSKNGSSHPLFLNTILLIGK